jgi:hypothetical protein
MSIKVNVHTRLWPMTAKVDIDPGSDLAWISMESSEGEVVIFGTVDRIEAMRRAAAALNAAFGEAEPTKEAAE